ncbi:MAG TPA: hypothetical protein VIF38_11905 [Burkholderiales bacterium]|jgi:hypothetical protein
MQSLLRLIVLLGASCFLPAIGYAGDVAIQAPRAGETIHDNNGNLTVALRVRLAPGERVRLLIDGAAIGAESRDTTVFLNGIDRGEHALQAQVVDGRGDVLATSAAVTFYMWQASSQFPLRKAQPPAQKK